MTRFLRGLYRIRGLKKYFDVVAIHPYARDQRGVLGVVIRARRIMNRGRDRRTPIWVTEVGWGTSGNGRRAFRTNPRGQARRLTNTYRTMLRYRRRYRIGMGRLVLLERPGEARRGTEPLVHLYRPVQAGWQREAGVDRVQARPTAASAAGDIRPACGGAALPWRAATSSEPELSRRAVYQLARCSHCGSAFLSDGIEEPPSLYTQGTYESRGRLDLLIEPLRRAIDLDRMRLMPRLTRCPGVRSGGG